MFKKKSYSDLEVQEIMETLFLEKKKVKDLQLKLSNCTLSPTAAPSEELGKLSAEISILHTRLEEAKQKELNLEAETKGLLLKKEEWALREQALGKELQTLKTPGEKTHLEKKLEEDIRVLRIKQEEGSLREHAAEQKYQILTAELKNLKEHTLQKELILEAEIRSLLMKKDELITREMVLEKEVQALGPLKGQIHQLHITLEEKTEKELHLEAEIHRFRSQLEEKDTCINGLEPLKLQIEALKAEIQEGILREKIAEQKRLSLENELHILRDLEPLKPQVKQLLSQIEEKDQKTLQLETEIQKLSSQIAEKTAEVHKLQIELEARPLQDKQKEAQLERVVQFMRARLEEAQSENQQIALKLTETEEATNKLKEELSEMQTGNRKVAEALQLERQEKQALAAEEQALRAQMIQLSDEIARIKECADQVSLEKTSYEAKLAEISEEKQQEEIAYQSQISTLSELFEKEKENGTVQNRLLNEQQALITANEEFIQQLSTQVANLSQAIEKTTESLKEKAAEEEEHTTHLRAAQAHLAKKMREAALLAEQNQELSQAIANHEQALESTKAKLAEAKTALEEAADQKQSLQYQYQENVRAIESQTAKWEEKYFQLQEKWQITEAQNKELKRLEERFGKLQSMFNHMGSLISTGEETVPAPVKKFTEIETLTTEPAHQPVLFDPTPKTSRYKESFFV